jgi:hypothetical protein
MCFHLYVFTFSAIFYSCCSEISLYFLNAQLPGDAEQDVETITVGQVCLWFMVHQKTVYDILLVNN